MDWRLKCLAFHIIEHTPLGRSVHNCLQRYVTGRYFEQLTPEVLAAYSYHVDQFRKLPPGATALEFGAGRNLLTPLLLSHAGAARVYAYDLTRLASLEQVNAMIAQLRSVVPGDWPAVASLDEDLARLYRIEYRAPADARATGLPDGSVDFVCSTSVLEHVPRDQIRAILTECKRTASPQALFSFIIDYHDHYGTADASIPMWHFYRYTDEQWRKFNPSAHFQNRLRHCDYQRLLAELDLVAVDDKRVIPEWAAAHLERTQIGEKFLAYRREDLLTANGFFLLRSH